MQNVIKEATPAHSTINDNPRVASIRANYSTNNANINPKPWADMSKNPVQTVS